MMIDEKEVHCPPQQKNDASEVNSTDCKINKTIKYSDDGYAVNTYIVKTLHDKFEQIDNRGKEKISIVITQKSNIQQKKQQKPKEEESTQRCRKSENVPCPIITGEYLKIMAKNCSTPDINKAYVNRKQKKKSSSSSTHIKKSAAINTNFIVNTVALEPHTIPLDLLDLLKHPLMQAQMRIYRCQLGSNEEKHCQACDSDAFFDVLKGLYDCYNNKNCVNCNCILCSSFHIAKRKLLLGEVSRSKVSVAVETVATKQKAKETLKRTKDRKPTEDTETNITASSKEPLSLQLEKLRKAKASGILPTLEGYTNVQREKTSNALVQSGSPLNGWKKSPDNKVINQVRKELGLPESERDAKIRTLGHITPFEKKTQKETILRAMAAKRMPTREVKTTLELKEKPLETRVQLEKNRKARTASLLTPNEALKQQEITFPAIEQHNIRLAEGKKISERNVIDKIKKELGLTTPKTKTALERIIKPILSRSHFLGPSPVTLDKKCEKTAKVMTERKGDLRICSLLALQTNRKTESKTISPCRITFETVKAAETAGLFSQLQGKTQSQKEKVIRSLANQEIPFPEAKTPSEKKIAKKIRAQLGLPPAPTTKYTQTVKYENAKAESLIPYTELKTNAQKKNKEQNKPSTKEISRKVKSASVITLLKGESSEPRAQLFRKLNARKPELTEQRTFSEKSPTQGMTISKSKGLVITPERKNPYDKAKMLRRLAKSGLPLPQGRTASDKELIKKIRTEMVLPLQTITPSIKEKLPEVRATCNRVVTPFENRVSTQAESIMKRISETRIQRVQCSTPNDKSNAQKPIVKGVRSVKTGTGRVRKTNAIVNQSVPVIKEDLREKGNTRGTCEMGCGCDKKKIRFKHSYVKIRVTTPDTSSLCSCPHYCPGICGGVFADDEGIKVTVETATGLPSYKVQTKSKLKQTLTQCPVSEQSQENFGDLIYSQSHISLQISSVDSDYTTDYSSSTSVVYIYNSESDVSISDIKRLLRESIDSGEFDESLQDCRQRDKPVSYIFQSRFAISRADIQRNRNQTAQLMCPVSDSCSGSFYSIETVSSSVTDSNYIGDTLSLLSTLARNFGVSSESFLLQRSTNEEYHDTEDSESLVKETDLVPVDTLLRNSRYLIDSSQESNEQHNYEEDVAIYHQTLQPFRSRSLKLQQFSGRRTTQAKKDVISSTRLTGFSSIFFMVSTSGIDQHYSSHLETVSKSQSSHKILSKARAWMDTKKMKLSRFDIFNRKLSKLKRFKQKCSIEGQGIRKDSICQKAAHKAGMKCQNSAINMKDQGPSRALSMDIAREGSRLRYDATDEGLKAGPNQSKPNIVSEILKPMIAREEVAQGFTKEAYMKMEYNQIPSSTCYPSDSFGTRRDNVTPAECSGDSMKPDGSSQRGNNSFYNQQFRNNLHSTDWNSPDQYSADQEMLTANSEVSLASTIYSSVGARSRGCVNPALYTAQRRQTKKCADVCKSQKAKKKKSCACENSFRPVVSSHSGLRAPTCTSKKRCLHKSASGSSKKDHSRTGEDSDHGKILNARDSVANTKKKKHKKKSSLKKRGRSLDNVKSKEEQKNNSDESADSRCLKKSHSEDRAHYRCASRGSTPDSSESRSISRSSCAKKYSPNDSTEFGCPKKYHSHGSCRKRYSRYYDNSDTGHQKNSPIASMESRYTQKSSYGSDETPCSRKGSPIASIKSGHSRKSCSCRDKHYTRDARNTSSIDTLNSRYAKSSVHDSPQFNYANKHSPYDSVTSANAKKSCSHDCAEVRKTRRYSDENVKYSYGKRAHDCAKHHHAKTHSPSDSVELSYKEKCCHHDGGESTYKKQYSPNNSIKSGDSKNRRHGEQSRSFKKYSATKEHSPYNSVLPLKKYSPDNNVKSGHARRASQSSVRSGAGQCHPCDNPHNILEFSNPKKCSHHNGLNSGYPQKYYHNDAIRSGKEKKIYSPDNVEHSYTKKCSHHNKLEPSYPEKCSHHDTLEPCYSRKCSHHDDVRPSYQKKCSRHDIAEPSYPKTSSHHDVGKPRCRKQYSDQDIGKPCSPKRCSHHDVGKSCGKKQYSDQDIRKPCNQKKCSHHDVGKPCSQRKCSHHDDGKPCCNKQNSDQDIEKPCCRKKCSYHDAGQPCCQRKCSQSDTEKPISKKKDSRYDIERPYYEKRCCHHDNVEPRKKKKHDRKPSVECCHRNSFDSKVSVESCQRKKSDSKASVESCSRRKPDCSVSVDSCLSKKSINRQSFDSCTAKICCPRESVDSCFTRKCYPNVRAKPCDSKTDNVELVVPKSSLKIKKSKERRKSEESLVPCQCPKKSSKSSKPRKNVFQRLMASVAGTFSKEHVDVDQKRIPQSSSYKRSRRDSMSGRDSVTSHRNSMTSTHSMNECQRRKPKECALRNTSCSSGSIDRRAEKEFAGKPPVCKRAVCPGKESTTPQRADKSLSPIKIETEEKIEKAEKKESETKQDKLKKKEKGKKEKKAKEPKEKKPKKEKNEEKTECQCPATTIADVAKADGDLIGNNTCCSSKRKEPSRVCGRDSLDNSCLTKEQNAMLQVIKRMSEYLKNTGSIGDCQCDPNAIFKDTYDAHPRNKEKDREVPDDYDESRKRRTQTKERDERDGCRSPACIARRCNPRSTYTRHSSHADDKKKPCGLTHADCKNYLKTRKTKTDEVVTKVTDLTRKTSPCLCNSALFEKMLNKVMKEACFSPPETCGRPHPQTPTSQETSLSVKESPKLVNESNKQIKEPHKPVLESPKPVQASPSPAPTATKGSSHAPVKSKTSPTFTSEELRNPVVQVEQSPDLVPLKLVPKASPGTPDVVPQQLPNVVASRKSVHQSQGFPFPVSKRSSHYLGRQIGNPGLVSIPVQAPEFTTADISQQSPNPAPESNAVRVTQHHVNVPTVLTADQCTQQVLHVPTEPTNAQIPQQNLNVPTEATTVHITQQKHNAALGTAPVSFLQQLPNTPRITQRLTNTAQQTRVAQVYQNFPNNLSYHHFAAFSRHPNRTQVPPDSAQVYQSQSNRCKCKQSENASQTKIDTPPSELRFRRNLNNVAACKCEQPQKQNNFTHTYSCSACDPNVHSTNAPCLDSIYSWKNMQSDNTVQINRYSGGPSQNRATRYERSAPSEPNNNLNNICSCKYPKVEEKEDLGCESCLKEAIRKINEFDQNTETAKICPRNTGCTNVPPAVPRQNSLAGPWQNSTVVIRQNSRLIPNVNRNIDNACKCEQPDNTGLNNKISGGSHINNSRVRKTCGNSCTACKCERLENNIRHGNNVRLENCLTEKPRRCSPCDANEKSTMTMPPPKLSQIAKNLPRTASGTVICIDKKLCEKLINPCSCGVDACNCHLPEYPLRRNPSNRCNIRNQQGQTCGSRAQVGRCLQRELRACPLNPLCAQKQMAGPEGTCFQRPPEVTTVGTDGQLNDGRLNQMTGPNVQMLGPEGLHVPHQQTQGGNGELFRNRQQPMIGPHGTLNKGYLTQEPNYPTTNHQRPIENPNYQTMNPQRPIENPNYQTMNPQIPNYKIIGPQGQMEEPNYQTMGPQGPIEDPNLQTINYEMWGPEVQQEPSYGMDSRGQNPNMQQEITGLDENVMQNPELSMVGPDGLLYEGQMIGPNEEFFVPEEQNVSQQHQQMVNRYYQVDPVFQGLVRMPPGQMLNPQEHDLRLRQQMLSTGQMTQNRSTPQKQLNNVLPRQTSYPQQQVIRGPSGQTIQSLQGPLRSGNLYRTNESFNLMAGAQEQHLTLRQQLERPQGQIVENITQTENKARERIESVKQSLPENTGLQTVQRRVSQQSKGDINPPPEQELECTCQTKLSCFNQKVWKNVSEPCPCGPDPGPLVVVERTEKPKYSEVILQIKSFLKTKLKKGEGRKSKSEKIQVGSDTENEGKKTKDTKKEEKKTKDTKKEGKKTKDTKREPNKKKSFKEIIRKGVNKIKKGADEIQKGAEETMDKEATGPTVQIIYGPQGNMIGSYPDHMAEGYPNFIAGSYADHVPGSYADHMAAGYAGHMERGYADHIAGSYAGHMPAGYSNHMEGGYADHMEGGFPDQMELVYADQMEGGYPDQMELGYADPIEEGYNNNIVGGYPDNMTGPRGQIRGRYYNINPLDAIIYGPEGKMIGSSVGTMTKISQDQLRSRYNLLLDPQEHIGSLQWPSRNESQGQVMYHTRGRIGDYPSGQSSYYRWLGSQGQMDFQRSYSGSRIMPGGHKSRGCHNEMARKSQAQTRCSSYDRKACSRQQLPLYPFDEAAGCPTQRFNENSWNNVSASCSCRPTEDAPMPCQGTHYYQYLAEPMAAGPETRYPKGPREHNLYDNRGDMETWQRQSDHYSKNQGISQEQLNRNNYQQEVGHRISYAANNYDIRPTMSGRRTLAPKASKTLPPKDNANPEVPSPSPPSAPVSEAHKIDPTTSPPPIGGSQANPMDTKVTPPAVSQTQPMGPRTSLPRGSSAQPMGPRSPSPRGSREVPMGPGTASPRGSQAQPIGPRRPSQKASQLHPMGAGTQSPIDSQPQPMGPGTLPPKAQTENPEGTKTQPKEGEPQTSDDSSDQNPEVSKYQTEKKRRESEALKTLLIKAAKRSGCSKEMCCSWHDLQKACLRELRSMKSDLTRSTSGFQISQPKRPLVFCTSDSSYDSSDYSSEFNSECTRVKPKEDEEKDRRSSIGNKFKMGFFKKKKGEEKKGDEKNGEEKKVKEKDQKSSALPQTSSESDKWRAEPDQVIVVKDDSFKGMKFYLEGKGGDSPGLSGIFCFNMTQEP